MPLDDLESESETYRRSISERKRHKESCCSSFGIVGKVINQVGRVLIDQQIQTQNQKEMKAIG